MTSHETVCLLNAGDEDAEVAITVYFADREPVGPYRISVAARRTRHVRYNDFETPARVPRGTDFASVIESSVPLRQFFEVVPACTGHDFTGPPRTGSMGSSSLSSIESGAPAPGLRGPHSH